MSSVNPARVRLHAASQWLARLAYAFATPSDDDSHSALTWTHGALHTQSLASAGTARLDAVTLALTLAGRSVPLADLNERQRYDAVIALLALVGLDGKRIDVALPWAGEAPDADPVAEHAVDPAAAQALAELYEGAASALGTFARSSAHASPVRLWPHHFDIATLVMEAGPHFESIGVGLAPDDEHIATPYWYVAPWPVPAGELPPAPASWRWQREGFVALVRPCGDPSDGDAVDASALAQVMEIARRATPGDG